MEREEARKQRLQDLASTYTFLTILQTHTTTGFPGEARRAINEMLTENSAQPDEDYSTSFTTGGNAHNTWEDVDELPDISHEGGEYDDITIALGDALSNTSA